MRLTTKGRFAVTAMIDLALRENSGPVALAATSPQMQNAIMIQLTSANAHLQEMIWRGCKPSSG